MKDIFTELYKKVLGFFQAQEIQKEEGGSNEVAKNRLKLVLMQDRTNLTPYLLERMRGEMIQVLSKYVEMDQEELELNFEQEGEQMALMLSIPVLRAKDEEEINEIIEKEEAEKQAKADENVENDENDVCEGCECQNCDENCDLETCKCDECDRLDAEINSKIVEEDEQDDKCATCDCENKDKDISCQECDKSEECECKSEIDKCSSVELKQFEENCNDVEDCKSEENESKKKSKKKNK